MEAIGEYIIVGETTDEDGHSKPILRYPFNKHIQAEYSYIYGDLSNGGIECVVRLVDCYPAELVERSIRNQAAWELARHNTAMYHRCMDELAFGNFAPGRWAWKLEYVARVSHLGIERGHQGLWTVPVESSQILPHLFGENVRSTVISLTHPRQPSTGREGGRMKTVPPEQLQALRALFSDNFFLLTDTDLKQAGFNVPEMLALGLIEKSPTHGSPYYFEGPMLPGEAA